MKKKIAIIIERVDITLGGAERSVFELASELSALGLEVDILAAKGQTPEYSFRGQANTKNIHILCGDKTGRRTGYFTFKKALKKHLSENRYDIIHSVLPFGFSDIYQPRGGTYTESILRNAASYQNKLKESIKRITAFANLRRTTLQRAEQRLCKNPDGPVIAAISEYVAEQFKRHYDVKDERIVIIPNGVKTDKRIDVDKANKLRQQIMRQLAIKETDKAVLFLFVANNFRLKGLAALLKAMQLASQHKTQRDAYLIAAGNGSTHKYRLMAKKLGIHEKIIFSGAIRHIQNALSIIDVAVLPTFYDPSSRFILEAIAAGKPVITTRFNGATDLFVNNRHGKIIDAPENIQALAEAINYFTNTDNMRKASEAIVADNLKEKVSVSRAAKQLESLYESILQRKSEN